MQAVVTNGQRVKWVDCCKGISIVLVVYGHTVGGLETASIVRDPIFGELRDWIYLFHIPAFFFLSGLFAGRQGEQPFGRFLQGRLRALFYPYLVWTVIFLGSQAIMGRFVNTPPNLSRALRCLWEPYGVGLWFLYTLFMVSVLFGCLQRARLPRVAILAVGLAGYFLSRHQVFAFWYVLSECMTYLIFFAIGGCYPAIASTAFRSAKWPVQMAAGAGLFALMTLLWIGRLDPHGALRLARALLGIAGVACVAMALARTLAGGICALLGAYSLEIYLAHPLWGTAARAVLLRSGLHSPGAFLACGVVFGVFGSLALALLCERFHFPYLFRWPAKPAHRAPARTPASPAEPS